MMRLDRSLTLLSHCVRSMSLVSAIGVLTGIFTGGAIVVTGVIAAGILAICCCVPMIAAFNSDFFLLSVDKSASLDSTLWPPYFFQ